MDESGQLEHTCEYNFTIILTCRAACSTEYMDRGRHLRQGQPVCQETLNEREKLYVLCVH